MRDLWTTMFMMMLWAKRWRNSRFLMPCVEEAMATHSSTLGFEIAWTEEPGRLQSMGLRRVGHDWATSVSLFTFMHWRRKWQPTPVFLLGEFQGWEPGGLPSMGSHKVGHDWCDLAAAAAWLMNWILCKQVTAAACTLNLHSVQSLSRVQLFVILWTIARQAYLSITNSWSPPKPMSIESVMPSNHLILCHPLLLLTSIFPSIRDFSNESAVCIRGPKYWTFSFNISPSNEHPGLISFRMDWLDLLAVQRTLKSLLQNHSSKASILQCSAFFIVQLSHPYRTTGKTIALTRQTFVGQVLSLLFNMLVILKSWS